MKQWILVLSLLSFTNGKAQNPDNGRRLALLSTKGMVDSMIAAYPAAKNFSSFAYAIVDREGIVYQSYKGLANHKASIAATGSTRYRIASMTKSFTALAILKLRDEGKLKLDDPAGNYIPELKKLRKFSTDAAEISIWHLLTHMAGFPEDNAWGDRQLDATDKALLQLTAEASLSTATGTGYEYSNLGFALLGNIITRVSGKPYQQYITQQILLPLGMKETVWEYSLVPKESLALGYRSNGKNWEEEPLLHDGAYGAMGGLITTIADYSRYMQLHIDAWPPRDGKESAVLKRSSLREMQQPASFASLNPGYRYLGGRTCATSVAYAFGLRWMHDCEGKTYVGHSGGLPGFGSQWQFLTDYGFGIVFFANETYAPTAPISFSILDSIVKRTGLQKRSIPLSPVLKRKQEALMLVLPSWKDAEGSGLFAVNFFADRSLADWKAITTPIFNRLGTIIRFEVIRPENALRGRFIIVGTGGSAEVFFSLSPEAEPKIQALQIRERGN